MSASGLIGLYGRDPFKQNSDRSVGEKRTKGGPVFSKLFQLDRTDPLSFGPKFPEILVEWIAPDGSAFPKSVSYYSPRDFRMCSHKRTLSEAHSIPSIKFLTFIISYC